MALLNLFQLSASDDQQTNVDKVNFNFDQILSMGGGPPGFQGIQGIQGVPGSQGVPGIPGIPGTDGSFLFIQPSTLIPAIPIPKSGDKWLQTDTLQVFEFTGSPLSWTFTGYTLVAAGIFKQGGTNNVVFTSHPTSNESLVLSSIDYGVGNDSPGTPNYRFKIVGASGNPLVKFAIDDGGTENSDQYQPSIRVQKNSPTNWDWIFTNENSGGDIDFIGSGNSLSILKAAAGVSTIQFDGTSAQLQLGAADKLLSFSTASVGVKFHFGYDDALSASNDRIFTISDDKTIGVGDAYSFDTLGNPAPPLSGFKIDLLQNGTAQLGTNVGDDTKWLRMRSGVYSGFQDVLQVRQIRAFTDGTSENKSSEVRIEKWLGTTAEHFISFHGGASDVSHFYRPQFRLGLDQSGIGIPNDGYYFGADINGRIGIGSPAFIRTYNDFSGDQSFQTRLNIESNVGSSIEGNASYGGIHFYQDLSSLGASANSGMTTGGLYNGIFVNPSSSTFAGVMFNNEYSNAGVSVNMLSSDYTTLPLGQKKRLTVQPGGEIVMWASDNLLPGGGPNWTYGLHNISFRTKNLTTTIAASLIFDTNAPTNPEYGTPTNIVIAPGTFTGIQPNSIRGGGFVGIGDFSAFPFVASNPQTKFQVNGPATFGTRAQITNYATQVGANSFTVGTGHKIDATSGVIIGGSSHQVISSANSSVIIGYNGGNAMTLTGAAMANKVAVPTQMFVTAATSGAPSVYPYFSSANPKYPYPNQLGIYVGGTATTNVNGLEILIDGDAVTGGAAFSVSRGFSNPPFGSGTSFVIEQDGKTGVGGNIFVNTDPGGSTAQWNNAGGVAMLNLRSGDIVLNGTTSSSAIGTSGSNHIATVSVRTNSFINLFGSHLFIGAGLTRNTRTVVSNVTGGDVNINGGDATSDGSSGTVTGGNVNITGGSPSGGTTQVAGNVTVSGGYPNGNTTITAGGSSGIVTIGAGNETHVVSPALKMMSVPTIAVGLQAGGVMPVPGGGGSGSGTLVTAVNYDRIISIWSSANISVDNYDLFLLVAGIQMQRMVFYSATNYLSATVPLPAGQALTFTWSAGATISGNVSLAVKETKLGL